MAGTAPLVVSRRAGSEVLDIAETCERVQRTAFELVTERAGLRCTTATEAVAPPPNTPREESRPSIPAAGSVTTGFAARGQGQGPPAR